MGIMQFNIPDDVKESFEAAFKGSANEADAAVAEFLRQAAETRAHKAGRLSFRERIGNFHAQNTKTYTDDEIRRLREEGRP